jgi:hypothetical protein
MSTTQNLAKAELQELDSQFENQINKDKTCQVQFNPESLKVSFSNQITSGKGSGDQKGTPTRQFVGAGTTKLSLQLWFDVTAPMPPGQTAPKDVRNLTEKVAYFITPKEKTGEQRTPPAVRFSWGSFRFDGIMESLEESLEFFSSDGIPLRASVSLSLTQQKIIEFKFNPTKPGDPIVPGTRPLTPAPAGSTVQKLADSQGKGLIWQLIAAANKIENPRMLQAGQLLDLNSSAGSPVSGIPAPISGGIEI